MNMETSYRFRSELLPRPFLQVTAGCLIFKSFYAVTFTVGLFITIQQKIATGILFIVLFGIGHCIPIAVAGSSAALVRRVLENSQFQQGGLWFCRIAGVAIAGLGGYFIVQPFVGGV